MCKGNVHPFPGKQNLHSKSPPFPLSDSRGASASAGSAQTPINPIVTLPSFPKLKSSLISEICSFFDSLGNKFLFRPLEELPGRNIYRYLEETNPKSSSSSYFCFSYPKHRYKTPGESNHALSILQTFKYRVITSLN